MATLKLKDGLDRQNNFELTQKYYGQLTNIIKYFIAFRSLPSQATRRDLFQGSILLDPTTE